MRELVLDRVPLNKKEAEQEDQGQEGEGEGDPLAHSEPPPAVVKPMGAASEFPGHYLDKVVADASPKDTAGVSGLLDA
jgi:hypothetical protein